MISVFPSFLPHALSSTQQCAAMLCADATEVCSAEWRLVFCNVSVQPTLHAPTFSSASSSGSSFSTSSVFASTSQRLSGLLLQAFNLPLRFFLCVLHLLVELA